jgi:hypothetical protein
MARRNAEAVLARRLVEEEAARRHAEERARADEEQADVSDVMQTLYAGLAHEGELVADPANDFESDILRDIEEEARRQASAPGPISRLESGIFREIEAEARRQEEQHRLSNARALEEAKVKAKEAWEAARAKVSPNFADDRKQVRAASPQVPQLVSSAPTANGHGPDLGEDDEENPFLQDDLPPAIPEADLPDDLNPFAVADAPRDHSIEDIDFNPFD